MVRLKIVSHSNRPLYPCFPRKWYSSKLPQMGQIVSKLFPTQIDHFIHVSLANSTPQNCSRLKSATLSIFTSQMVCLKIVLHSNGPLYPCFPRKWYTSKLLSTQIGHFIHVSLANGTPPNCFQLKWATLSMFPSQMVRLKIVLHLIWPLYPCFPRKWYTSKLLSTKIGHFIHVSLANGMPPNCFQLKSSTLSMFPSQMVRLKIVLHLIRPLYPCFPRKWYASKLFPTQIDHFIHVSLANSTPQNCSRLKSATLSMFPSQMVCLKIVPY